MTKFRRGRISASGVQEHREAIRLAWKSRHLPFGMILLALLLLGTLLPTVLTILAQGPANPMP